MVKIAKKIGIGIMVAIMASGFLAISGQSAQAALKDDACKGVNYALYGTETGDCGGGTSVNNVWGYAYTIISWVLIAVGILCVVFIIIGAVKFMTSGGDPEKVKSGKNTILYAVIGLVIAILANVIVSIVFNATGTITS